MTERVVLAYSGGLDTSVAIGWIADATQAEVVAVAVDVGQGGEDLEVIRQRALDCGAVEAYVADAKDEFADEYCLPALQANALEPLLNPTSAARRTMNEALDGVRASLGSPGAAARVAEMAVTLAQRERHAG